jgi:superfamily I DNA/RNA helicase
MAHEFLEQVGLPLLTSLSPDYEAKARLGEVVDQTHQQLDLLYEQGSDLLSALDRFSNDQAIRLLTVHKSKGLEFHSVIMPAIETQTFWGKPYEERCSFFVGVSRAKDRLLLTNCEKRFTPPTHPSRWSESRSQHAEFLGYVVPFLSQ